MIRTCIFFLATGCFGCEEPRYQLSAASWQQSHRSDSIMQSTWFGNIEQKMPSLHGNEVKLQGRLVYEYDDVAIYPFNDPSDFKPVSLQVDEDELHDFLVEHDDALVTITGTLDTTAYYDERQYSGSIKDIVHVEVSHRLAAQ